MLQSAHIDELILTALLYLSYLLLFSFNYIQNSYQTKTISVNKVITYSEFYV